MLRWIFLVQLTCTWGLGAVTVWGFDDTGRQKICQQVVNALLAEPFLWDLWEFDDAAVQKFEQEVINMQLRGCGDTSTSQLQMLICYDSIHEGRGAYAVVQQARSRWDAGLALWVPSCPPDGEIPVSSGLLTGISMLNKLLTGCLGVILGNTGWLRWQGAYSYECSWCTFGGCLRDIWGAMWK